MLSVDWHKGEKAIHSALHIPREDNPTTAGLAARYAPRIASAAVVAVSATDSEGRVWVTAWGGERGCAGVVARDVLALRSKASVEDPVFKALWGEGKEVVTPGDEGGREVGGLMIDFESRDRVKFAGKMLVGAAEGGGPVRDIQMGVRVEESIGNCPKYITKRKLVAHKQETRVESAELPLDPRALEIIQKADVIFVGSGAGAEGGMDANHRGGAPGFVRVVKNEDGEVVIAYPEYSGNRLYQTLGNLEVNPAMGITIPDLDTSDVLYLSGTAKILAGPAATSLLHHTPLAITLTVTSARLLASSLPFRAASAPTFSPYNPPVRPLRSEKELPFTSSGSGLSARFTKREVLSPAVARVTFEVSVDGGGELPVWRSGEAVTLDFSPELDNGYAHMKDDEPQALNDDYIRTFTVSSPSPFAPSPTPALKTTQITLTIRKQGPATSLLWKYNPRADLTLPVLGFGSTPDFLMPTSGGERLVFVAGGVGITPFLSQAPRILSGGGSLELLWGVRGEDLPFVEDSLAGVPGLARATRVFVTGDAGDEAEKKVKDAGARIEKRRMCEGDLKGDGKRKFYVCAGEGMMRAVMGWLEGEEDVAYESFNY